MGEATRRFARTGEFALRIMAEEAMLVPVRSGEGEEDSIFTLNDVGAAIWQLVEPGRDAAEIGRLIAQEFDVSVDKATEDVAAFLELLVSKGLVEEV